MRASIASVVGALLLLAAPVSMVGAQGSWIAGVDIPTPRSEIGAAVVNDQVVVLGGGSGPTQQTNEILDLATNTWRRGALMPRGLNHHAVIAYNGGVYVFGGADEAGRPTNTALVYDITTDSWRSLAPLPTPRSAPGVAVLNDQIWVVAGIGARDTPVVEIYDPATDAWSEGPAVTVARDHFSLQQIGGRLYAMGGRIGSLARNLDTVEIYDPAVGQWEFGSAIPEPRSGISGVTVNGLAYIFGGEDTVETHGEVFIYDPATDSWSTGPTMPTPRQGLAAVLAQGQVHVFGGGLSPGGGSDSSVHEILTP